MLARLDGIDGVERSFANYTGSLIRLRIAPSGDRATVAAEAIRVLCDESPEEVSAEELQAALNREEWRDLSRVEELTAIELRTVGMRGAAAVVMVAALAGLVIVWRRHAARATVH